MASLDDSMTAPVLPAPVPRRGPLSLAEFFRTLRDNMIATYAEEAYERDIVERKMFGRRRFLINEPAAIKHVLIDNAANYQKTEITRRILEPGLGRGLITSEGDTWRQHRRTMSPAFDHRSIASYAPIMTAAAQELLAQWSGLGAGAAVDVATAMMQATLNIISRTMFSSDSDHIVAVMERGAGRYQAQMRPNIMDFLDLPAWLAGLSRIRVAHRTLGEFDTEIDRLIRARSGNPENAPKDLLARLIAARDEQTGGGMTAQEVRDHVITIFMAGHETTAMAMTWTWYLLSQHAAEEAKLHAELEAVLGGRAPGAEDIAKLTYTRMVIDESMRLYPPVHTIAREALADDTLAGLRVPRGSAVLIAPWVLHRHVKLWRDPGRFDPERFSPEHSAARARFSYLPFGGGRRICIGAAFATAEATLLLATIAQRFRLRLAAGHPVEPQGLITLRARHGMKMLLIPRV
ncbi:MAG TPA: cytochrome P450 [Steroidobacteraceae bacterium]|nr:cytochrome P450 [Steroidobacteraceae bacterium]